MALRLTASHMFFTGVVPKKQIEYRIIFMCHS